ncbi:MAG: nuclear transport factor 2 family protein [Bacteroidetes bacterium]|nr:nuclear transport factor 2 family protein [Bacteroidota bacterium]
MANTHLETINLFFEAYSQRNITGIKQVMDEQVKWIFPGHHPLAGVKSGVDEVVAFFDAMGKIMGESNIKVKKLISGINDDYVVECQHILTNRKDGNNLDHHWCVLWTFRNGKIIEGRHFAGDQHLADSFFCKVYK